MKAKIKTGGTLISDGNYWDKITDSMIVNLWDRWIYKDFKQKGNHLFIYTELGDIDIVFTGEVPVLKLEQYVKNQLIFSVKKKAE